jgi:hypothetical protein
MRILPHVVMWLCCPLYGIKARILKTEVMLLAMLKANSQQLKQKNVPNVRPFVRLLVMMIC